ncbi:phytanoyl-CoA dioxygenase family protein [Bradyrhizobium sp. INPA03-11B]|uniref:phytanoyl-CoA dioxygenase family protein n=1 Tax=Bradyrhizobium sp. INPA03-11B TaxID=418598 RepID=UPI00338DEEA1
MDTKQVGAATKRSAASGMNVTQGGKICLPEHNRYDLTRLTPEQAESWIEKGYFVLKEVVDPVLCAEMTDRAIALFSEAESDAEVSVNGHHKGRNGTIAIEEEARINSGGAAHLRMSKLYNLHRAEPFKSFASNSEVVNAMHAILGPDVAVFNSQYILKNPGVWGQPWHQDSLYFFFDRVPQVGVWLATSRATVENGCLFVAPGSHLAPIHEHIPDARPGANFGYVEIVDYDFSDSEPVMMETGDVLVFHSFLMHMSNDNNAPQRRSALVYHYGHADTQFVGENKSATIDFMRV